MAIENVSIPPNPDFLASKVTDREGKALEAINNARAKDPSISKDLVLPTEYWSLPVDQQLLFLVNDERVNRGLNPIKGIDYTLQNKMSQPMADAVQNCGVDLQTPHIDNCPEGENGDRGQKGPADRLVMFPGLHGHTKAGSSYQENLALNSAGAPGALYTWIYDDGDNTGNTYTHRKSFLFDFSENAYIGIGYHGAGEVDLFNGGTPVDTIKNVQIVEVDFIDYQTDFTPSSKKLYTQVLKALDVPVEPEPEPVDPIVNPVDYNYDFVFFVKQGDYDYTRDGDPVFVINNADGRVIDFQFTNNTDIPITGSGKNGIKIGSLNVDGRRDAPHELLSDNIGEDSSQPLKGNRVNLPVVEDGQTKTIKLEVPPGSETGPDYICLGIVQEGVQWFKKNELCFWVYNLKDLTDTNDLVINDLSEYSYEWVQTEKKNFTVKQGESVKGTVKLKNTGTATWYPGLFNLGTVNPVDSFSNLYHSSWFPGGNRNRVILPRKVKPGETVEVDINLQGEQLGPQRVFFQGIVETAGWIKEDKNRSMYLGALVTNQDGTIPKYTLDQNPSAYNYEGVDQSDFSNEGTIGDKLAFWFEIKNTGTAPFVKGYTRMGSSGECFDPVKLGGPYELTTVNGVVKNGCNGVRLIDTSSRFADSTEDTKWLQDGAGRYNRIDMMNEPIVWSGEVARFEGDFYLSEEVLNNFPSRVQDDTFVAQFFTPVMEHITWMKDMGVHLGVRVA